MAYYERPEYKLIKKDGDFELRKYEKFYIVKYRDSKDINLNSGFQTLFSYISKNNSKNQKISMTVPVIEEKKEDAMTMSFVVPKEFFSDIPKPKDSRLEIEDVDHGYYAVVSFKGTSNEIIEKKQENSLKDWVERNQWEIVDDFMVAYYNPPFIPGIFKKNEIWVKIAMKK